MRSHRALLLYKRLWTRGCPRCLCTTPGGSTGSQRYADRTKLEGDIHDEAPEIEAQREFEEFQEQQENDDLRIKQTILSSALSYVPQHGWSKQAITSGAEAAGYPPITHGLISNGPIELVHHFYESANQDLADNLRKEVDETEQGQFQKKRTTTFIRDAVVYRLNLLVPYIHTWPQAMGLMALPQNIPGSLLHLSHLVDDIWYYAGDRSTDFNFYTKRATLAAAIKATELHMLQDDSADYEKSWVFLDRRLENLGTVGKNIRQIQGASESVGNLLFGFSLMARNMIGLNRQR